MRKFMYTMMAVAAIACTVEIDACQSRQCSSPRWGFSISFGDCVRPSRCCFDDYCDEEGHCVEYSRRRRHVRGVVPRQQVRTAVNVRRNAYSERCCDHCCESSEVFYYRRGSYR